MSTGPISLTPTNPTGPDPPYFIIFFTQPVPPPPVLIRLASQPGPWTAVGAKTCAMASVLAKVKIRVNHIHVHFHRFVEPRGTIHCRLGLRQNSTSSFQVMGNQFSPKVKDQGQILPKFNHFSGWSNTYVVGKDNSPISSCHPVRQQPLNHPTTAVQKGGP